MSFKNIGRAAACLVFAVAPGLVLANSVDALTTCEFDKPVEFDGRHYEVVSVNDISWVNANKALTGKTFEGVQGHLATITSEAEDRFVESLRKCALGRTTDTLLRNAVWVGGFQSTGAAEPGFGWQWVNDEGPISTPSVPLLSYSNWLPNEPNDAGPKEGGGNEQHLTIGHTNKFGWNDERVLGNIGGYIIEYDTARIVDTAQCLAVNGCETTEGQILQLPPIELPANASLGVRTYEFTDNPGRCGEDPLELFDGKLIIPPYLCGSPKFLVVEINKANVDIKQGTVLIENEPLLALPGNWYECDGQTFGDAPLLRGDPQARDVVAWQATLAAEMLEDRIGPGEDSQFAGALGEFTFECGSSRGLTRNLSYLVIGMHINFGDSFQGNPDFVIRRFVDLTGYKLQLLQQSVQDSIGVLGNGDFTSMRALVRNAIRYHGRGDFDEALEKIEVFLQKVDEAIYADSRQNYNGEHLARGKNIKFMYEEKVIPFAP